MEGDCLHGTPAPACSALGPLRRMLLWWVPRPIALVRWTKEGREKPGGGGGGGGETALSATDFETFQYKLSFMHSFNKPLFWTYCARDPVVGASDAEKHNTDKFLCPWSTPSRSHLTYLHLHFTKYSLMMGITISSLQTRKMAAPKRTSPKLRHKLRSSDSKPYSLSGASPKVSS